MHLNHQNKFLYIIAGCNGAGKTTASYNILPHILDCKAFVNADEIAKGLSPFDPDSVKLQAGRLMLGRIQELLQTDTSFAIEMTLATKNYQYTIQKAQERGYTVILIFFWLQNDVIERRYTRGIKNLFEWYMPLCDKVQCFDNTKDETRLIFTKHKIQTINIENNKLYQQLRKHQ